MFSKFFSQNVNILCHHCLFATFVAVINAEFLNIFVYIRGDFLVSQTLLKTGFIILKVQTFDRLGQGLTHQKSHLRIPFINDTP